MSGKEVNQVANKTLTKTAYGNRLALNCKEIVNNLETDCHQKKVTGNKLTPVWQQTSKRKRVAGNKMGAISRLFPVSGHSLPTI